MLCQQPLGVQRQQRRLVGVILVVALADILYPFTVLRILTSEPCVLRMFGHDGEFNTCVQSVPKKFRDGLHANENQ